MQISVFQPEKVFQALADQTRLRLLRLLAITHQEICLCEFVDSLQEPHCKLSRHLKILREAGLLAYRKSGRWVFHSLLTEEGLWDHLWCLLRNLPDEHGLYQVDLQRYQQRVAQSGPCYKLHLAVTVDTPKQSSTSMRTERGRQARDIPNENSYP